MLESLDIENIEISLSHGPQAQASYKFNIDIDKLLGEDEEQNLSVLHNSDGSLKQESLDLNQSTLFEQHSQSSSGSGTPLGVKKVASCNPAGRRLQIFEAITESNQL